MMLIEQSQIRRILIFKLCCIGDIVMMTPSINALRKKFPDAKITIVVNSWVKDITSYLRNVDRVIISDALYEKSTIGKINGAFGLIRELRKHSFDMVLLGHRNNVFGLITMLSGIKYRLGFCGTKFLNFCEKFREDIHESERYLSILKSIGIDETICIPELKRKFTREEILSKTGLDPQKKVIGIFPFGGINPGTDMNIKRWELEKFLELVKRFGVEHKDVSILLFEGSEKSEKIADKHFGDNVKVMKIGTDLISSCDVMLCNDTGAMHIAAAIGIPTLTIFGPTDPKLLAPLNPHGKNIHRIISKNLECSPCYNTSNAIDRNNGKYWQGNKFICHIRTHDCMKLITVDEVFYELSSMIKVISK